MVFLLLFDVPPTQEAVECLRMGCLDLKLGKQLGKWGQEDSHSTLYWVFDPKVVGRLVSCSKGFVVGESMRSISYCDRHNTNVLGHLIVVQSHGALGCRVHHPQVVVVGWLTRSRRSRRASAESEREVVEQLSDGD